MNNGEKVYLNFKTVQLILKVNQQAPFFFFQINGIWYDAHLCFYFLLLLYYVCDELFQELSSSQTDSKSMQNS